jgi:phage terminase small subunit
MSDNGDLTNKQEIFIREYLKDFNATRAAISAGYSRKTAAQIGAENLIKLKTEIEIEKEKLSKKINVEISEIVNELRLIAFSDMADFIDINEDSGSVRVKSLNEIDAGKTRVIHSVSEDRVIKENNDGSQVTVYDKFKFRLHDKLKALELLGRYKSMFTDNVNVSGEIKGIEFVVKDGSNE